MNAAALSWDLCDLRLSTAQYSYNSVDTFVSLLGLVPDAMSVVQAFICQLQASFRVRSGVKHTARTQSHLHSTAATTPHPHSTHTLPPMGTRAPTPRGQGESAGAPSFSTRLGLAVLAAASLVATSPHTLHSHMRRSLPLQANTPTVRARALSLSLFLSHTHSHSPRLTT